MNNAITIPLTGRRPVSINPHHWPVVAEATWDDHDGQVRPQANRRWKAGLRVRQHADGRAIVYGWYDYFTHYSREHSRSLREGELLAADGDVAAAIARVGDRLHRGSGLQVVADLVPECLAALPGEAV